MTNSANTTPAAARAEPDRYLVAGALLLAAVAGVAPLHPSVSIEQGWIVVRIEGDRPKVAPNMTFLVDRPTGTSRITPMADLAMCTAMKESGVADRTLDPQAAACVVGSELVKAGDDRWFAYEPFGTGAKVYGAFEDKGVCEVVARTASAKGTCGHLEPTSARQRSHGV